MPVAKPDVPHVNVKQAACASNIPLGNRAPTPPEWDQLAARAVAALNGRRFAPTQTIEESWGIERTPTQATPLTAAPAEGIRP